MPKLLFSERDHPELTYSDAFLVPHNPILDRLFESAEQKEIDMLLSLNKESHQARKASRSYIKLHRGKADIALQMTALQAHTAFRCYALELADKYPQLARQVSRDDVDFSPVDGFGNTPIVVANMNNVAGKRMAEAMAMMGGSAAVPQDKEDSEMKEIGSYLHSRDVRYMTPIVVGPHTKVHELKKFLEKRDIDTAIVTEDGSEHGKFVGLIKMQEPKERLGLGIVPNGLNEDLPIGQFIRDDGIITGREGMDNEEAIMLMEKERVHVLPVLCDQGNVKGVFTKKMAAMRWRYKPHVDEECGGLAMLGTVGALHKNPVDRVKFLLDQGVKGIIFDTAHFDQGTETYKNVHAAADIIAQRTRRKVLLVAGNVVTPEAALDIYAAGADVAKVGIGPGAMCSTRMETGVGRPQLSAVLKTARAAKEVGKNVWADGGIQHPRDVALALAAGASQVMVGSIFASTHETPSEFQKEGERLYKENYGMASRQASVLRNLHKLERDMRAIFREAVGHRAEGISGAKVFQRKGLESVSDMVHNIVDGVTSAMTYMGARNLDEYTRFARIGVQTGGGYAEGAPRQSV